MRRRSTFVAVLLLIASPAAAVDMPTRKAGLWELKMEFAGRNLPTQLMQQCTDAATDKLMTLNFGGAADRNCQKRDVRNSGSTITVDSVCTFGDGTTTSHAVVSGDFNSAYTVQVNSTRQGGRPMPGAAPGGETQMTIAAKWLGPCATGQRPGDVMMGNGMKMNVLDLQNAGGPPGRP
ncbi:MAG TPA: DUF3617 family protein [Pseudolabrys sp.]|nr:DUF3617 family protein [Pseudolabrys sp.]